MARILLILISFALALGPAGVWAQGARTAKIVVPYPPGSGPDILSRLMAEEISRSQARLVVENRPGGATLIGTEAVARAAPDGNTVLLVANTFVVNPALKKGIYDIAASFEPVCQLARTPMVLVVQASSPYRTLADLLATARAKPGALAFSSAGPNSSLHVALEVLKRATGISYTYLPYAGTAPALTALLGGHVAATFADYPTVVSHLQSGTLRGLITASRTEWLTDVPTFAEAGLAPYEANIFYGVVAPAKTPPEALAQLASAFMAALSSPDMQPRLAKQGLLRVGMCGAEFGAFLGRQAEEYSRIVREAGMKPDF